MKHFAVIGDPIAHSRSPELYAPMFEKAGIDADFLRLRVSAEELFDIRETAKQLELSGFAVTMPHKRAIIPYLDALCPEAEAAGAVNVVTVEDGRLIGHNTDGRGAVNALSEAGITLLMGKRAVILGRGGAAAAAEAALRSEGCGCLSVARQRVPERNGAVRGTFLDLSILENAISMAERITGCLTIADILINATPLGMEGGGDFSDLSFINRLRKDCTVFDFVYRPDGSDTSLISAAKEAGLCAIGGERLLYHQGLLAFALWTGVEGR